MRWLDPVECLAARECLQRGNALEAAQLLLSSPQKNHLAARRLLLEINKELIEQAVEAYGRGDILVAWENINCARQCTELDAKAAALREKIAREAAELRKQQEWRRNRLRQARAWADQGRVRSAIGLLKPLTGEGEGRRLRIDLDERLARFERYVQQCRELLDQGELTAARKKLTMAQAINTTDPLICQLENELRQAEASKSPKEQLAESRRVLIDRSVSFALGDHALVVSRQEIVVGNPLGESVNVPIQSRLHRRHVLIVRDRGCYGLVPYAGCKTLVNGDPLTDPRQCGDGDVIELGGPQCRWTFSHPVAASTTAVLEQAASATACARTPDGVEFRRIVLLDDTIEIRPKSPAHLVLPELPCRSLTFRWSPAGLVADARDGTLVVETADGPTEDTASGLAVPSRLAIHDEVDEAELLGRAFVGDNSSELFCLNIHGPF